jgi:predicted thioesterase
MIRLPFLTRTTHETPCTIEVEHSETSLHAHVNLDDNTPLQPGDRVRVHGASIQPVWGEKLTLRRMATVERASWLERQWTKISSNLELYELYEVSFTERRL